MRFNKFVQKCGPEFNKVLKGKLGRAYKEGLREEDTAELTLVVFNMFKELMKDSTVKSVLTPIGSFKKYVRAPYRNYSPVKEEYQTIEGGTKCKFKMDESVTVE